MKGQVEILKNLFSFAFGVVMFISVLYLFNNIVTPKTVESAVDSHALDTLDFVVYLIKRIKILTQSEIQSHLEMYIDLPQYLASQSYILRGKGNQLCIIIETIPSKVYCEDIENVWGDYYSGSFLYLTYDNGNFTLGNR